MQERWWYLSFVDPEKGWQGACCVGPADDYIAAIRLARAAGCCNPGGEVLAFEYPRPAREYQFRLLDKAAVEIMSGAPSCQVPAGGPCTLCERGEHGSHDHWGD